MNPHRTRGLVAAAVVLASIAACTDPPTASPSASVTLMPSGVSANGVPTVDVVMQGLDSPRGLAWGPEGALYVVEAGNTTVTSNCVTVARGLTCYSGTGAVSRLYKGRQERVASGLPSLYLAALTDIGGPNDIDFQGRGNAWVTIGFGGNPALRAGLGSAGAAFGHLVRLQPSGGWSVQSDISAFEAANNPAGGPVDSNPYGVLAEAGRQFVTDAGGNALLEVTADGRVSLVSVFPTSAAPPPFNQSEPVPTEVKRGPDGALYVSTLTGAPFVAGSAAIYRVVPGGAPTVYEGGFKTITDFDFGPDGSLYVIQYASAPVFFGGPGLLIRVAPDGTRTTLYGALTNPTGVLVGPDGAIYVSNRGNVASVGEVLRIVP
jgi:glucose/arabinose dehydrogenase